MSVESLTAVLHHSRAKGTAKLVLVGIANHDGDGGAYPAVTTLARYANADVRTVQRCLEKLESIGELVIHIQAGGSADTPDHERTNRYDVLVSCPVWCDRSTHHRDTRSTHQPNLRGLSTAPRHQRHRVTPVSPGGVTPVSPKPSLEPRDNYVSTQGEDARACSVCSRPSLWCAAAQRSLTPEARHTYDPVTHASR